ncbi:hypothetical protein E0493_17055 [Roseomonas sp. M0104]|uniref:Uncharacterized protein n=1 Tax=Teichococcus coralli TaxID=2545983 RepID=A0A845BIE2_9PROT|nr:hypothetical protein [Pseudoroseomonas coralli]MXP65057.1 hypothetical protein [Pseudoroseomonas coralli]
MVTRIVRRPVSLTFDEEIIEEYKARGVTIAPAPGESSKLVISAPDEAAADAAEIWLAEMDTPAD